MNHLAVALVVILLPGIFATIICDKIVRHSRWDWFKYALYSIILGWISYLCLQLVSFLASIHFSVDGSSYSISFDFQALKVWNALLSVSENGSTQVPYDEIMGSFICSFFVAFLASAAINYKVINIIAQRLKISTKYGDENLFSYYLNHKEICWVYIRDISSQLTYKGQIVMYSETNGMQELVLTDVDVYEYEDSEHLYSVPSMYLCKNIGEFRIEAAFDTEEQT